MRKGGLLVGMAVGAGLVYLLDPVSGAERRTTLRRRIEDRMADDREQALQAARPISRYGSRAGDISGLESATLERRADAAGRDRLMVWLGSALALYGVARRGLVGTAAQAIGTGVVWRELRGTRDAVHAGRERRRTVDIQKTLFIAAPVDRVYEFWTDYENFPLFMSNVREVRDMGGGRSHWVVSGPGGMPIEWFSSLTEQVPGERLAWRSRPGSMLENAGVVRFSAEGEGTRVDLRFCYYPPAGGAGEAVAELLGADPRAKLNEDLGRLKSLLEGVEEKQAYGGESRRRESRKPLRNDE